MSVEVKVAPNGRVMIPADVRKALGLENGGTLMLSVDQYGITLTNFQQRLHKVQALYRRHPKGRPDATSEEFVASKRAEAAREDAAFARKHP